MARSWNGFAAQNELIKAQWRLLEAGQAQVEQWAASLHEQDNTACGPEDEELFPPPEPGRRRTS